MIFYQLSTVILGIVTAVSCFADVYFKNDIDPSDFIGGVVYCTEVNQYGTVPNYACNRNVAAGNRIDDIKYGGVAKLGNEIFTPYHSKLKIFSLSLTLFSGDISGQHWGSVVCNFPKNEIVKNHDVCITFTSKALKQGYNTCAIKAGKCN